MLCSLNLHHFSLHQSLIFELLKEEEKKLGKVWTASIGTINQTINKIRKREIKIVWLNFEKENIKMSLRKKSNKSVFVFDFELEKKVHENYSPNRVFANEKKNLFIFFLRKTNQVQKIINKNGMIEWRKDPEVH